MSDPEFSANTKNSASGDDRGVTHPNEYADLIGYFQKIFGQTHFIIDMGAIAAKVDAAIATDADAKAFFNDLDDIFHQLAVPAEAIDAILDLSSRINKVESSHEPVEELFVQSVDLLANCEITLELGAIGALTSTILTLSPAGGAVGGLVAGWAAHEAYDHYGQKFVEDSARTTFRQYIAGHNYIGPITSLFWTDDESSSFSTNVNHAVVVGGIGDDQLTAHGNTSSLAGGGGDDTLDSGSSTAFVDGGAGTDTWVGNLSDETRVVIFDLAKASTAKGQTLVDGTHVANIERVNLTTGCGNDVITLNGGEHSLYTGAGDDTLNFVGTTGDSGWQAGDGQDHLVADMSAQTTSVSLLPYNDGSNSGNRLIWSSDGSQSQLYLTGVETLNVTGGSGGDQLYGGYGNDVLNGNAGNDQLIGNGGDDVLIGGDGDDTLISRSGVDRIDGGAGNDLWLGDLSDETRVVIFDLAKASTAKGQTLVDGTHVADIERVNLTTGSGNDVITLNGGEHSLYTGAGDDTLNFVGTTGDSGWQAGDGQDHLVADMSAQTTSVSLLPYNDGSNSGNRLIWNSDGSQSHLYLTGVETLSVTGGSAGDQLDGGYGNDILNGNAGNDQLIGNGGDDILNGGTGADSMSGGAGDDTYYVDNVGDAVSEGADAGHDRVIVTGLTTYVLPDNVEDLILSGPARTGTGNALDNAITGSNGSDVLHGLDGADILNGGAGNDHLYGDGGIDHLLGGTGNDLLEGGADNDTLSGNDGADTLRGGAGRDILVGGAGADQFQFFTGDTGSTKPTADRILDFSSADHDQINLSPIDANTHLAGNQAFTFIGTAAFSHHAGELDYAVIGPAAYVAGDVDGDGVADFYIRVDAVTALAATDFVRSGLAPLLLGRSFAVSEPPLPLGLQRDSA